MLDEKSLSELADNLAHYRGALRDRNIVGELSDGLIRDYHELLLSSLFADRIMYGDEDAPETTLSA